MLSTDLVGSTRLNQSLGDEAAAALEKDIEGRVLEQIEKHRGVVVLDTGDGVMAAFQSARRAVACARELQRMLGRRNRGGAETRVEMRIGLHTGEVLADDGEMHGETVIVAKRVEEAAPPSGILASDTVHGVLGTARTELEDRGEFELKGISSPWRLFEVPWEETGEGGVLAASEPTPFVGRGPERAQLRAALQRTFEGSGCLFLLSGEAGVGKSRLAAETADEARVLGMLPLTGRCRDMEGAPPYLPLLEQMEEAGRSVSAEQLREALGENAPEVAKLVPELRQRFTDIPAPVELPPDQERRYLLHGVSQFLERAARARPLLLLFEDLHWADESTLLLVRQLAQRLREIPVMVIGTYRHTEVAADGAMAGLLQDLLRERQASDLALRRLDEAGVAAILAGRAGQPPPPELVTLVYSETEGNPFFAEEVFRHLLEADKLFEEKGRFRSGIQIADTEVPRSVGLVIGRRLEGVSEDCRRALTAAAVTGRIFRFDLIARLDELGEDQLVDVLEEAVDANLVEDASTGREARYGFVHEQIRQTLLSKLSLPRRQRLHLRVADGLESLHGARSEERAVEIGHHLYQAGAAADGARATRYLELAGRQTLEALAFEEALRHFDAAREVLPEPGGEAEARLVCARALSLRGAARIPEALEAFVEAAELAPEGPSRDEIRFERARLQLDLFRGRDALDDLETLLTHAREAQDRSRELEALLALGRAHYILSLDEPDFTQATRDTYEACYELARDLGDRRAMAKALLPTVFFVDYWPDYHEKAEANVREAAAIAEELEDEELAIDASTNRLRLFAPGDAAVAAEKARAQLEARRDPIRLKEHYFWLMWQYWLRADFEQCVEICDAGIDLAKLLGVEPVQYPTIKALALMDLGRFAEAWTSLEDEVADEEHRFGRAMQQLGVANYCECLGATERATTTALEVLEEGGALKRAWMQRWMLDLLATAAARTGDDALRARVDAASQAIGFSPGGLAGAERTLAAGDAAQAVEIARGIATGAASAGFQRARQLAQVVEVRALARLGKYDEMASVAEKAIAEATASGFRYVTWRLRAERAHALRETGDADGALREAEAARSEAGALAGSIPDPELRSHFEAMAEAAVSGAA